MSELAQIKDNLKRNLSTSQSDRDKLDKDFQNVDTEVLQNLFLIGVWGLIAFLGIQTIIIPIIFVIWALYILYNLATGVYYKQNQQKVLGRFVYNWFDKYKENQLNNVISRISLTSLRNVSSHIYVNVHIPDDGKPPSDAKSFQISPGVFVEYRSITVRVKCDFRVIRSHMSQSEVSWIFQRVAETLPAVPPDVIEVIQYSSTKHFSFTKSYLDKGTIDFLYSRYKAKPAIKSASSPNHTSGDTSSVSTKAPSSAPAHRTVSSYSSSDQVTERQFKAQNKLKLLLSDIQERRESIEEYAMEVAMNYEILKGRIPKDVSKSNLGFDIYSTNLTEERRIEVKGLGAEGNVILTKNEQMAAAQYKKSYYLYIVENCLSNKRKRLIILQDLSNANVHEEVVNYKIAFDEQERASDIVCHL